MNKRVIMMTSIAFTLACAITACGHGEKPMTPAAQTNAADLVLTNGQIYSVNQAQPWAQSMAIKNGKIIAIGNEQIVSEYIGKDTQINNLHGKMVMPGIHDVHIHPLESGSDATHFTLREYDSIAGYQDALLQAANQHPDAEWLIGYGHAINTLLELEISPRELIDEVLPNRPVIIMEQTSHSMWVNSKALALANINQTSRDPIGGVLGRDENHQLDGILYDNAGNLVMDLAMQSQGDEEQRNYTSFIDYTQPELLKHGVTSISDARVYWQRGQLDTWQKLAADNQLAMRVSLGLWAYPEASDESQIKSLKSLFSIDSHPLLKVDQIKFYMDGILVNTTAAMKDKYQVNWLELEGNKGLNYFSKARLEKYIKALEPAGFDFNIHAIGDRGISEALDAIETASSGNARHRITHVEVVDPQDYKRFAKLGVIADAQVAGDFSQPEHWHEMSELLGPERADHLIPIKSLLDNRATLTLSSDWNVSTLNPFIAIGNAVSRTPEAITLAEAIKAYTINAAFAMRQENVTGSLEVGKFADFIILEDNIFELTSEQLKRVKVKQTWLAGELVYQK